MRNFNYSEIKNQKWDSDILGLIAAISYGNRNWELLAWSERFNLVNVNTFNGLATHVSKTVKQSNRVIVKGSLYNRMIKYTVPCKCKYCEEMSEYDVEYSQYEITATSVRQDVEYIPKSQEV